MHYLFDRGVISGSLKGRASRWVKICFIVVYGPIASSKNKMIYVLTWRFLYAHPNIIIAFNSPLTLQLRSKHQNDTHECMNISSLQSMHYSLFTFNTLIPRLNCHNFTDDTFKFIFVYDNFDSNFTDVSIQGWILQCSGSVLIITWHWTGSNSLAESMMV